MEWQVPPQHTDSSAAIMNNTTVEFVFSSVQHESEGDLNISCTSSSIRFSVDPNAEKHTPA